MKSLVLRVAGRLSTLDHEAYVIGANDARFREGETDSGEIDKQKGHPISLPLKVHAELTSNPKQIDWCPEEAQLDSQLDGLLTNDGKFHPTSFSLRKEPFDDAMAHSWAEITKSSD
jgi:hypothetical protein